MMRHAPASLLLAASSLLLMATRVPGTALWATCAVVVGVALLALAVASLGPERPWLPPLAFALLAAGLLLPTSRSAWLAGLPAPVLAGLAVLAMLYAYRHDATEAPQAAGQGRASRLRHALRFLPPLALAGLAALLPALLLALAPARVGSAFELAGAAGPAVALAALAIPVLALALLVRILWGQDLPETDGEREAEP
jgi:hypothetical protein